MASAVEILRLFLGSVYILFAPGLAWTFVFFPKVRPLEAPKETPGIDWIERVAISFGLSIALVPLSVFFLNYFLKVPINTWSVVLIVALLTAGPLAYVYWKRRAARPRDETGATARSVPTSPPR